MSENTAKCNCNTCSGHIAFDVVNAGQQVACPHCGIVTTLYAAPPAPQSRQPAPQSRQPAKPAAKPADPRATYCTKCGTVARAKKVTHGSAALELFLYVIALLASAVILPLALLLFVGAIIYSCWRSGSKSKVCPACGSPEIIPADSPNARRVL